MRWSIAAALAGLVSLAAQPAPPPGEFAELAALAQSELSAIKAPGAAIAIVQGDRIVYQQGVGIANVETGQT